MLLCAFLTAGRAWSASILADLLMPEILRAIMCAIWTSRCPKSEWKAGAKEVVDSKDGKVPRVGGRYYFLWT